VVELFEERVEFRRLLRSDRFSNNPTHAVFGVVA